MVIGQGFSNILVPHKFTPFGFFFLFPVLILPLWYSPGGYIWWLRSLWACDVLIDWISRREKPWFVMFADFYGINIPIKVDFKLLTCSHWMQVWEIWIIGSCEPVCAGSSILLPLALTFYDCGVLTLLLSITHTTQYNSHIAELNYEAPSHTKNWGKKMKVFLADLLYILSRQGCVKDGCWLLIFSSNQGRSSRKDYGFVVL